MEEIEYWIINSCMFVFAGVTYMACQMYKDLKRKDKIIEVQDNYIKYLEKQNKDPDNI